MVCTQPTCQTDFWIPYSETKQKTLEEIAAVFGDKVVLVSERDTRAVEDEDAGMGGGKGKDGEVVEHVEMHRAAVV